MSTTLTSFRRSGYHPEEMEVRSGNGLPQVMGTAGLQPRCAGSCSVRPPVLLALSVGTLPQPSPPFSESRLWSQLIGRPAAALLTLISSSFASSPAWKPAAAQWSPLCPWPGPSVSWTGLPAEFWGLGLIHVSLAPSQDPGTAQKPGKVVLQRKEAEGSLGYQNALSGWNFPTPKKGKTPNCGSPWS